MKQILIPALICCVLPLGCQSASLSPSRFTAGLFGPKKTDHTLASSGNTGTAQNPSSDAQLAQSEFGKGEACLQKGDFYNAKKHFKKVVQQSPEHAGAHHRLAYIADKDGDYNIAEIHYLAAHRIEPKNVDVMCDLGYSYLLQDRLKDSRRYLEKALSVNPQHQASLLNLASLHGKQGDYAGALALFRQAGSEQEAQANIARMFPQGPPAGTQLAQSSSQNQNNIAPETRELQRKLAEKTRGQQQTVQTSSPRRNGPADLTQMDPREIPPERINELFAQIDQQHGQSPGNTLPSQIEQIAPFPEHLARPAPSAVQQIPTVAAQMPSSGPSSLPGELPLERAATGPQDYTMLTSGSSPAPNAGPAQTGRESPYFQTPPAQRPAPQSSPAGQQPWMNQNPVANMNPAPTQPAGAGGMPFQTPPPRSPSGRLNLNVPESQSAAAGMSQPGYEEAMALALQMGMNAGPGQMFPVTNGAKTNHTPSTGSSPVSPRGAQPDPLELTNPFFSPGPPAQAAPPASQSSPAGSAGSPDLRVDPASQGTPSTPPDWPYQETQAQRPISPLQPTQTPSASRNVTPADAPWLNSQPTSSPAATLPQTTPANGYLSPQQWPHSPQQGSSATPPPAIHRGSNAPSAPPVSPNGNPAANALPQVVPGVR